MGKEGLHKIDTLQTSTFVAARNIYLAHRFWSKTAFLRILYNSISWPSSLVDLEKSGKSNIGRLGTLAAFFT